MGDFHRSNYSEDFKACKNAAKYKGIRPPRCQGKYLEPCDACFKKYWGNVSKQVKGQ